MVAVVSFCASRRGFIGPLTRRRMDLVDAIALRLVVNAPGATNATSSGICDAARQI